MTGPLPPAVGARFRRMKIEPLSGIEIGFAEYTVQAVHPPTFITPFGRVELAREDDGRPVFADLEHFWGTSWEALDNVISLRAALASEPKP